MSEEVIQAGVNYWARVRHWRHVQQEAKLGVSTVSAPGWLLVGVVVCCLMMLVLRLTLCSSRNSGMTPLCTSGWLLAFLWKVSDWLYIHRRPYSPYCSGRAPEATRELQKLVDGKDVSLACSLALINAHKQAEMVDKDAVAELEVFVEMGT